MDDGADQLLQGAGTESGVLGAQGRRWAVTAVCGGCDGELGLLGAKLSVELAKQICIVLVAHTSQQLEADDEESGAHAACSKHAAVLDVPRAGEEARVDDGPVPEHLDTD